MNHEFILRAFPVGDLMSKGRTKSDRWGEAEIKTSLRKYYAIGE